MLWWPWSLFLFFILIYARCSMVLAAALVFSGQLLRTSLPLLLPQAHTYIPPEILLWKLACLCLGLQGRKGRSDDNIMKIKRK